MDLDFVVLLILVAGFALLIVKGVASERRFRRGHRGYRWGSHKKPPKWATLKRSGRKKWKKVLRMKGGR